MKPGRELDALIAEKVMGWPAFAPQVLECLGEHLPYLIDERFGECMVCGRKDKTSECLPHYSTDIKAAWEVVEKMQLLVKYSLIQYRSGGWLMLLREEKGPSFEGSTAPHAICLAALEAIKKERP